MALLVFLVCLPFVLWWHLRCLLLCFFYWRLFVTFRACIQESGDHLQTQRFSFSFPFCVLCGRGELCSVKRTLPHPIWSSLCLKVVDVGALPKKICLCVFNLQGCTVADGAGDTVFCKRHMKEGINFSSTLNCVIKLRKFKPMLVSLCRLHSEQVHPDRRLCLMDLCVC